MKSVIRSMGTFLVAALAVALVICLISYSLIPELSQYVEETFPDEKNLELISVVAVDPDGSHVEPADGEVYETESYRYTFSSSAGGWLVATKDKTKSKYPSLCEAIYGKPVVRMKETFEGCASLTQAPAIPKNVRDMTSAFSGCSSLKGSLVIYASPTTYDDCFAGTNQPITISGSSSMLTELSETSLNGNVSVK